MYKKLLLAILLATPAIGQFIGDVGIQTLVNNNAAPKTPVLNAVTAPTVTAALQNIGNTNPCMVYSIGGTGAVTALEAWIEGSFDGTLYYVISDVATNGGSGSPTPAKAGLCAFVFTPLVRIRLNLFNVTGGVPTFSANYVSSSVSPSQSIGIFGNNGYAIQKVAANVAANVTGNYYVNPPRGASGGTLFFFYSGGTCTNSSITVYDNSIYSSNPLLTPLGVTLPASGNIFLYDIKSISSSNVLIQYIAGTGCGATTYYMNMYWGNPLNGTMFQGPVISGSPNLGNPDKIGCAYNSSLPTVINGSVVDAQCDQNGKLLVTATFTPSGTQDVNLVKVAGVTVPTLGNASQPVSPSASTSSTIAYSFYSSAALEASAVVSAAPANFFGIAASTNLGAAQVIQCFNSTTVPVDGTAPTIEFWIGANNNNYWTPNAGIPVRFSIGIACSNSSTLGTKTLGSADTHFMVTYK